MAACVNFERRQCPDQHLLADATDPLNALRVGASALKAEATPDMLTTTFEYSVGTAPVVLQVFGRPASRQPLPVILYFHGGLFNCGTIQAAFAIATALSEDAVIVCVDYPLAPAMRFPQTIEVAYAALEWVAEHAQAIGADAKNMFVAGEQAGGNLAAVVAMLFRDRGLPLNKYARLRGQILINPMLDASQTSSSMVATVDSPCRRAWADYIPVASDGMHPYVSPVNSCRLAGLAPALVITGHANPLRDEAEGYASKLLLAGVPVQVRRVADEALNAGAHTLTAAQHQAFGTLCQLMQAFLKS